MEIMDVNTKTATTPGNEDTNTYSAQDVKKRIETSYNVIAPHYLQWSSPSHEIRLHYLNRLLSHFSSDEPKSVLDLGCGAGIPCTQLLASRLDTHVTGCDISSTQLSLAAERLPANKVNLIQSDMMGLAFPNSSFDAIVAFYSIIHVPRDEQEMLLARIGKWLKPGGWFLANFMAEEADAAIQEQWLGEEKGWMFWSGWHPDQSAEMVRNAGLELSVNECAGTIEKDAIERGIITVPHLWIIAQKPKGE